VASAVNAATVAVKVALVPPTAMVAEAGAVTLELLLDSVTLAPPAGAAPLSVIVQVDVPAPLKDEGEQLSALTTNWA
jgi:hypothetical protein